MPFILMRRADIPNGVLQVDDLKPNDSQRNYTLDPPGQSGYVRQVPTSETVTTSGADPILTVRSTTGLASYLIDNVEDQTAGEALTAAIANDAAAAIIARVRNGSSVTAADVAAALVTAGAGAGTTLTAGDSTGSLTEVLDVLSGRQYQLPGGATLESGGAFVPGPRGSFASAPGTKSILAMGAFHVSNGGGDLFNYKQAAFTYNGTTGAALLVLDDDGTVL